MKSKDCAQSRLRQRWCSALSAVEDQAGKTLHTMRLVLAPAVMVSGVLGVVSGFPGLCGLCKETG